MKQEKRIPTGQEKTQNAASLPAKIEPSQNQALSVSSIAEVVERIKLIQELMSQVMKEGEHYGKTWPGADKPSLKKPGAEKLGLLFHFIPEFDGEKEPCDLGNGHREYIMKCTLRKFGTDQIVGQGVGSCSTMETKYRFRTGEVKTTGKPVPKEYWENRKSDFKKAQEAIGGKGFAVRKVDGNWQIVEQGERVENDNPANEYNTILKMAKKRAHIDAMLTATGASDIFTQDLDEESDEEPGLSEGSKATSKQAPKQNPLEQFKQRISATKNMDELRVVWEECQAEAETFTDAEFKELAAVKNAQKEKLNDKLESSNGGEKSSTPVVSSEDEQAKNFNVIAAMIKKAATTFQLHEVEKVRFSYKVDKRISPTQADELHQMIDIRKDELRMKGK